MVDRSTLSSVSARTLRENFDSLRSGSKAEVRPREERPGKPAEGDKISLSGGARRVNDSGVSSVFEANLDAAAARLDDLEAARKQADATKFSIRYNAEHAEEAHTGLRPENVAQLLAE